MNRNSRLLMSIDSIPPKSFLRAVVVLSFAMVFWSTGVSWRMFSFWMSVAVTNTQLGNSLRL